jgi:HD-like signal output (HDOD) protein
VSLPNQWIERIQTLPVLPQVAMRITERIQSPTATLKEISDLIKTDMGLTSTILRLANSSYYSIPGGVADVSKALQYLGFNTIAQSILTASFIGCFKATGTKNFPLSQFWAHSFAVGLLSEITTNALQHKNPGDAFIAGLMHDVGKLVCLEAAPEELTRVVNHAEAQKLTYFQAETELGVPSHCMIGEEFGKFWKLPETVLSAIRHHHAEAKLQAVGAPPAKLSAAQAASLVVQWADAWVNLNHIGNSGNFNDEHMLEIETSVSSQLGLSEKHKTSIEAHFVKEFEKAGALLNGN